MRHLCLPLALMLAACTEGAPGPAATDLSAALVARQGALPPAEPEGACWTALTTPAVFETVTEQVLDRPERRAPDGTLISPATFRTQTHQALAAPRQDFWFERVCEAEMTQDLIATLQRALKARGLYTAPVTGVLDRSTQQAIRAWQRPRGLDSEVLALATARALGLVRGAF